jgi:predicted glycosyltransferase
VNEHDAIARIKRLSHSINCADEIAEVIERLIKERDEARRMYCEEVEHHHETVWNDGERDFKPLPALDVAISKGWDCYKEDDK